MPGPGKLASAELKGVRETVRDLRKLGVDAADLKAAHVRVAALVTPYAAAGTRRRTGALAASWAPIGAPGVAKVRSTLEYAGPIEFGWPARGIPATLAVFRAVDEHAGELLEVYREELAHVIAKYEGPSL